MNSIYRGFEIVQNPHGGFWAKKLAEYPIIAQDRETEAEIKEDIDAYWCWEYGRRGIDNAERKMKRKGE